MIRLRSERKRAKFCRPAAMKYWGMSTGTSARGIGVCAVLWCCSGAHAAESPVSVQQLARLSIEELMDISVTSVSKKRESLGGAAAAVAVVTGEDIKRSGATTIPDALRLVPGLHVARVNSSATAVSVRGFSSVNSEKALVLSDTRSIYTPLFSGVFWDVQDYLLEDLDQIEVIRGPGATLWGSNAVNGVINITTKPAQQTHGTYFEALAGTEERSGVSARYGAETAAGVHYRVFGKYIERDDTFAALANDDNWRLGHLGFRADWDASERDVFTVQGDWYDATIGQLAPSIQVGTRVGPQGPLRADLSGGNLLGRWQRKLSADSDLQLRVYYDRTRRDDPSFRDVLDTSDIDVQYRLRLARNELVMGFNYRYTSNDNSPGVIFRLQPQSSNDELISAFIQDEIELTDALHLTIGTKLEENDFSGFELQPSVRFSWDVSEVQTLWTAVSRAARTPTRLERDIAVHANVPASNAAALVQLAGNEDFDAEELTAYEAGYRWQVTSALGLDVAAFYNVYDALASLEQGQSFVRSDGQLTVPIINRNLNEAISRGLEVLINYTPLRTWRLSATYSFIDLDFDRGGADLNNGRFLEGATPRHQVGLRSILDVGSSLQLDAQLRRSSSIRRLPLIPDGTGIDGYTELDVHVAWRARPNLQISVVGQNLLDDHHVEFGAPASRGEIERGVYGKVAWDFR
jgi:iron complex outermembrane receptor protein